MAKRQKAAGPDKTGKQKTTASEQRRTSKKAVADPATEAGAGVILHAREGAENDPMSAPGPGTTPEAEPIDIASTAEMTAGDENARPPDVLTPHGAAVDPRAIEKQTSTGRAVEEGPAASADQPRRDKSLPGRARRGPSGDQVSDTALNALVAERAYHIFLERGAQHGHAMDDWLRAEREVRERLKARRGHE